MGEVKVSVTCRKIVCAFALMAAGLMSAAAGPVLDLDQSQVFRSWFVRIIKEQFRQGPSPRWEHRDCAGLIRFAVNEAFKRHDARWLKANGLDNSFLPPELNLKNDQAVLLNQWKLNGGKTRGAFAPAISIAQDNGVFISKDINQARLGDLLFFDQGEDQHLMIWMGSYIAYHTGNNYGKDNGLRTATLEDLGNWTDTRWQPKIDNPNFVGVYRLSFLSQ